MKIGITGGAGYIGSKLVRELIHLGHEVRIIDNLAHSQAKNLQGVNVEFIQADILDEASQEQFLDNLDFVYHLLALSHPGQCDSNPKLALELNTYATHSLLNKVKKNKQLKGFLFPSAVAAIYGEPKYTPVDEDHPVNPANVYGIQKRAAELFGQFYYSKFGVPTVIVRQSNVYGPAPGMKYNSVISIFLKRIADGEGLTILGTGNQVRNFIHIDDLIDAYTGVLKASTNGGNIFGNIYNLGGEAMSIKDLAYTVAELGRERFGSTPEIRFEEGRQEIESRSLILSTEKAKNAFGFSPKYTIRKGLEDTLEYIMQSEQI